MKKIIETKRMYLRELCSEDVPLLMLIFSDPEAMKYYPRLYTEEDAKNWITTANVNYKEHGGGMWACHLKDTDEFVGICGLHYHRDIDGQSEQEVGYLFVRKFWKKGLATEAASACTQYLKKIHPRIISLIRPENIRSIRVAERNGFKPEKEVVYKGFRAIVYVSGN